MSHMLSYAFEADDIVHVDVFTKNSLSTQQER